MLFQLFLTLLMPVMPFLMSSPYYNLRTHEERGYFPSDATKPWNQQNLALLSTLSRNKPCKLIRRTYSCQISAKRKRSDDDDDDIAPIIDEFVAGDVEGDDDVFESDIDLDSVLTDTDTDTVDDSIDDDTVEDSNSEASKKKRELQSQSDQNSATWAARRKAEAAKRSEKKTTWDDKIDDDPLKSNSPTTDFEPPVDPFTRWFIAIGDVLDSRRRSEAWIHHMQWVRRTVLKPDNCVSIDSDYTRLSEDCMTPQGQVLVIRANRSQDVLDLVASEPLSVHKAIKPWRLFELDVLDHRNTTWYLTDPMIHYAFRKPSDEWLESSMRAEDYHIDFHAGVRVAQFGYLRPVDAVETTVDEDGDVEEFQRHLWVDADVIEARRREKIKASVGVFVVLNSKTIRGAKQYIENDPLMKNSLLTDSVLSPVNLQDVSGLHHLMARSFSQRELLDQIHFMDPEDLLKLEVEELPGLHDHATENLRVLTLLQEANLDYGYDRWSISELFDGDITEKQIADWNLAMSKMAKIRTQSIDDLGLAGSGGGGESGDDDEGSISGGLTEEV